MTEVVRSGAEPGHSCTVWMGEVVDLDHVCPLIKRHVPTPLDQNLNRIGIGAGLGDKDNQS
jgi:hypothetical protein